MKSLSLIWKLVIGVVIVAFAFLAWNFVDDYFSKDDEVKAEIATNQTDAAIASGKDTVTTINNQHTREIIRTDTVRTVQGKVNEAPDAHSAHTAGVDGLCVVSPDLCPEDGVQ